MRLKTSSGDHYIKRFLASDNVDLKDAGRLVKKGVRELYIQKQYKLAFTSNATKQIFAKLKSNTMEEKDKIELLSNSVDILRENILHAELTNETIELAQETIESVKKIINSSPKLKALLDKVIQNKSSYRYKMIQLTSYLSFHIISNLEWGTREQQEKLAYVALIHDITLSDDTSAMIRSEDDFKNATSTAISISISQNEKSEIQTHAFKASEMVLKLPAAPFGTEVIIKQHHGSPGGFGFPSEISDGISPLAMVFLLCEDYANYLIKNQTSSISMANNNINASHALNSKELFVKLRLKHLNKDLFDRIVKILESISVF
ncbi:MAG: hypothetical protein HQK51_21990 [Oligoflexia bacterium]|nr:hypothetical protein [Oligoflexia bacterium]